MEYLKSKGKIVLKLQKGEEVISSLSLLIGELDIKCASVSGIGATDNIVVGVFNPKTKVYTKNRVLEDMEILSLSGNLTRKDGAPYVHVHGAFASLEKVYGGHINECYISATAEIIIDVIDSVVEREFDEEIGLNLLKL
ncbi:MAG: DNA-binding protein [Clostridia bacterium]|nr:DNA-binding protein [Clostridia bacterium]